MVIAYEAGERAGGVIVVYILSLPLAFWWLDLLLGNFGEGMSEVF